VFEICLTLHCESARRKRTFAELWGCADFFFWCQPPIRTTHLFAGAETWRAPPIETLPRSGNGPKWLLKLQRDHPSFH